MILGNEMTYLGNRIMNAALRAIRDEAEEGGRINTACIDAITKQGLYKYVYWYEPTVYIRRYDDGGLADNENFYTKTSGNGNVTTIFIEDRTPAGDGGMINPPPDPVYYLSDIIESGANGPKWHDPDWPGPRPYLNESLDDECPGWIDDIAADVVNAMPTIT